MTTVRERRHQIDADHPSLAGHFPGRPLVPGVLILDRVEQTAGARLLELSDVKFVRPLLPEQRFIVRIEIDDAGRDDSDSTGGSAAAPARARFVCTLADDGQPLAKGRMLLERP